MPSLCVSAPNTGQVGEAAPGLALAGQNLHTASLESTTRHQDCCEYFKLCIIFLSSSCAVCHFTFLWSSLTAVAASQQMVELITVTHHHCLYSLQYILRRRREIVFLIPVCVCVCTKMLSGTLLQQPLESISWTMEGTLSSFSRQLSVTWLGICSSSP